MAKTTTPGQSVEQQIVARGTRAGCQPAASARTWDAVMSFSPNNIRTCSVRAARSGKLAPLQDAALRRATQACSVRGSRQGPRREAVRPHSPACARKCASAALLQECVCVAACSTAREKAEPSELVKSTYSRSDMRLHWNAEFRLGCVCFITAGPITKGQLSQLMYH